jgi:hypothetical protein
MVFRSSFVVWSIGLAACAGAPDEGEPDAGEPDGGVVQNGSLMELPLEACNPRVFAARVPIADQTFSLLLDTGSATMAVVGDDCASCAAAGAESGYAPGETATGEGQQVEHRYGAIAPSGWIGDVFSDVVGPDAYRTRMRFASIIQQDQFIVGSCGAEGRRPEGVVGLQPRASAIEGTDSFIDAVIAEHQLADIFSLRMCQDTGTLWIGGIEPSSIAEQPRYTPLWPPGYSDYVYTASLWSIAVDGHEVQIPSGEYVTSLLDTGSDHSSISPLALDDFAAALATNAPFHAIFESDAASFFDNPSACVAVPQTKDELDAVLPPLVLTFGDTESERIQITAPATESYLLTIADEMWCPAIVARELSPNFETISSILGAPVLRSHVLIFDRAQERVGVGPQRQSAAPVRRAVVKKPTRDDAPAAIPFRSCPRATSRPALRFANRPAWSRARSP